MVQSRRPVSSRLSLAILVLGLATACAANSVTETSPSATSPRAVALLDTLEQRTFAFFWERSDPVTGLTPDRWPTPSFSSIAAVGFALTAYPIGVDRGYVTRGAAATRTLNTLRFLWATPQGAAPAGVSGHHGFFYHFLDMKTGLRFETVELSTVDTALLLAGVLFCRQYFDGPALAEASIRALADSLYRRVDWPWAQMRPPAIAMGWRPEDGVTPYDWRGYNEAMLVYILALGSPTHPVGPDAWKAWTAPYKWGEFYDQEHLGFPPLFGHHYSHIWIDFRGIQDEFMAGRGIDYFENSRRATLSQRSYAIANPDRWIGYDGFVWGLSASDGPIDATMPVAGTPRRFFTYAARGASYMEPPRDDGTIAPTAAGGSIAFAPEVVIPALVAMRERYGDPLFGQYGFLDAFNPTFQFNVAVQHGKVVPGVGWFDTDYLGIDQGPILAMLANHRTDLVWRYMRQSPYVIEGLRRAGFRGGWLDGAAGAR